MTLSYIVVDVCVVVGDVGGGCVCYSTTCRYRALMVLLLWVVILLAVVLLVVLVVLPSLLVSQQRVFIVHSYWCWFRDVGDVGIACVIVVVVVDGMVGVAVVGGDGYPHSAGIVQW